MNKEILFLTISFFVQKEEDLKEWEILILGGGYRKL